MTRSLRGSQRKGLPTPERGGGKCSSTLAGPWPWCYDGRFSVRFLNSARAAGPRRRARGGGGGPSTHAAASPSPRPTSDVAKPSDHVHLPVTGSTGEPQGRARARPRGRSTLLNTAVSFLRNTINHM